MSEDRADVEPFQGEIQNAIFGMLMALVQEYSKTMPAHMAVQMACDWLVSLANHVKETSKQIDTQNAEKQNQFFPHVEK